MGSRADETKARILAAAIDEFSEHGIAGARVDRISGAAGVNGALLFRYFGSKSELFDAAFGSMAATTVDEVPFDANDLSGYAGRLVDYYEAHPALVRLSAWYQLERSDDELPVEVARSYAAKIAQIRKAQRAGRISRTLNAHQLLNLVIHLSIAATGITPVLTPRDIELSASRAAIVMAVRTITS